MSRGPGPDVMDAASLTGDDVVIAHGEDLGKIKAIMLDVPSGEVAYSVLSFGGLVGVGDKLFAIPWSALLLDEVHKRFIFNVSKQGPMCPERTCFGHALDLYIRTSIMRQ